MYQIDKLNDKITIHLKNNHNNKLQRKIMEIVTQALRNSLSSEESYCAKFKLPIRAVATFPEMLGVTKDDIFAAFDHDWATGAMRNHMHSDPYYQTMLSIMYYAIKSKNTTLKEQAFIIICMKLWNGRKIRFFPWCDPKIMKYVVNHMTSNRHHVSKYSCPFELIHNWAVPTMFKKYEPEIMKSPAKLQNIFEAAHTRIRQLFVSNPVVDKTGKKMATGGLLPLYMKAKAEGLSIDTPNPDKFEQDTNHYDYMTNNNLDDIINNSTDKIVMSLKNTYPDKFIELVRIQTKVSPKIIHKILNGMHNHKYYDNIHSAIGIILSQTKVKTKHDICASDYMVHVRTKVIKSKNNKDAKELQIIINDLVESIFKDQHIGKSMYDYSVNNQIQLRKILIYGIVFELKRILCS